MWPHAHVSSFVSWRVFLWFPCLLSVATHVNCGAARIDPSRGALALFPPETHWYNATLDHFHFDDDRTFKQKYLVYTKFWKPNGPILFYMGNEGQIEDFYNNTGIMFEMAPELGALILFVEHRYYGSTMPFGNASLLSDRIGFLTIEQALADYAEFIVWFKSNLGCSEDSPENGCKTVLFGGSYGGMLAAWFRIKYPHLSVGALAASAPVDFYPNTGRQGAFWNATLHTYRKYGGGGSCDTLINHAMSVMKARATTDLSGLGSLMRTCAPLQPPVSDAYARLDLYVRGALSSMAMVDYPVAANFVTPMPANPVRVACAAKPGEGDDGLLHWLNNAVNIYLNSSGQLSCHDVAAELIGSVSISMRGGGSREAPVGKSQAIDMSAWNYQACTELILEPLTSDGFGFYPPAKDQIQRVMEACEKRWHVRPRPHWIQTSTGGSQLTYASNIIFSNGEKDPWRTGAPKGHHLGPGVVNLFIPDAAHHEDLRFTTPYDPPSVAQAKSQEKKYIQGWLTLDRRPILEPAVYI